MNEIDISVVIPTKNGQNYLDSVLKGVFSQEINAKFEVIIVDSGSTDKSLDIITQYPLRCYQIKTEEFNHGLTRNFGISKSQGKYIVLMTQDAIPYDNLWMKKLVDTIERDKFVAGVYSRQIPHKESHILTQIRTNRFLTAQTIRKESQIANLEDYNKLSPKEKYFFCNFDNVSSCIRRSVWEEINFPKTDFAEDLEWSKKVLESGHKIIYEPNSIVYHSHDFSVFDWYKRNRINYNKLYSLFGMNTIDKFYKLFAYFIIYTIKDFYYVWIHNKRNPKIILPSIFLIPPFSFTGALGQYTATKNAKLHK